MGSALRICKLLNRHCTRCVQFVRTPEKLRATLPQDVKHGSKCVSGCCGALTGLAGAVRAPATRQSNQRTLKHLA
jgi:hypothetical protein